ncbi:hypothetical protein ACM8AW_26170 [Pseudomonas aeruginosa]|uniref:hypothetical protein n=1 Tax=Pseudomonas aeruginosa TaxID=287 RepID=UPI00111A1BFC|nr:hypothetical protein [Pseudomonas aeruginosa]MBX5552556.1 hypothetical protein [Pseudomonas aeruginosa]MBX6043632.1 hypothetical protein [Pseudomonas aeruginosa]HBO2152800.1 hypothetical protein [Pseudomonas aeruginosa]
MSQHTTNIRAFAAAASSSDPVVSAYCGMVAIELVLKQAIGLPDHNVPSALNLFAHRFAIDNLRGCKVRLASLSTQLSNALKTISVQGKDGVARFAPAECYPYIRYTRHTCDGWTGPTTTQEQAEMLAHIVNSTRSYLATKFQKAL